MAIGTGAKEERAMATTIASAKANDMATVTEMKREQGQRQREMERWQQWQRQQPQRWHIRWRLWRGQYLKWIWGGGGGEGQQIIFFNLIMHLSTILLLYIIIKQQSNYPNIKSMLSSFKVASIRWWNKRSANISSRWPLQRRWAILCITNICSWWSITRSIWGRREHSIKRQTRRKSSGWGRHIGKADMSISWPLQSTGGGRVELVSGVLVSINIFRYSHVLNFRFVSGKPP